MPVSEAVVVATILELSSNLPSQTTGTDDQLEETWKRELCDLRWVDADLMGRACRDAIKTLKWFPPFSEFMGILEYTASVRDAEREAAAITAARVDYDPNATTPEERQRWAKEDADIAVFWAMEKRERESSRYLDGKMPEAELEHATRSYRAVERLFRRRYMSPSERRMVEARTEQEKRRSAEMVDAFAALQRKRNEVIDHYREERGMWAGAAVPDEVWQDITVTEAEVEAYRRSGTRGPLADARVAYNTPGGRHVRVEWADGEVTNVKVDRGSPAPFEQRMKALEQIKGATDGLKPYNDTDFERDRRERLRREQEEERRARRQGR